VSRVVSAPNGNYSNGIVRLNGSTNDLLNNKRANQPAAAPQPRPPSTSPSNSLDGENASVSIRIQPDGQGRFGFNITGIKEL
jgi:hypothetical protein